MGPGTKLMGCFLFGLSQNKWLFTKMKALIHLLAISSLHLNPPFLVHQRHFRRFLCLFCFIKMCAICTVCLFSDRGRINFTFLISALKKSMGKIILFIWLLCLWAWIAYLGLDTYNNYFCIWANYMGSKAEIFLHVPPSLYPSTKSKHKCDVV